MHIDNSDATMISTNGRSVLRLEAAPSLCAGTAQPLTFKVSPELPPSPLLQACGTAPGTGHLESAASTWVQ